MEGRFDLPPPRGTCYLALDAVGALLELVGPQASDGAVSETFLANRRLRRVALPRLHRLADLTARRASGRGVTAEIHTIVPYALPQAWAKTLARGGADGVRYQLRHDPSFKGVGVGLFGKVGERRSWKPGRELSIDDTFRSKLYAACGLRVLPIPRIDQLRVIDAS